MPRHLSTGRELTARVVRRIIIGLGLLAGLAAGTGLWLTRANTVPAEAFAGLSGDAARGEAVFWAGGCASCHSVKDAKGDEKLVLAGGQTFPSPFGTFVAPNISMDSEQGIGDWSFEDFRNAVRSGVSPAGSHYFPVFPYTAYALATPQDITDLWAFWQTMPASDTASQAHDIAFPFSIRRGVGVWKLLYACHSFQTEANTPELERGRYLVEALSHCTECHTPRDALGGLDRSRWLAGAPDPSGKGTIPAITPDKLTWSQQEIAQYLNDGFTPDFDSAGGHMVYVIENLSRLPVSDRQAIAAYLKALPNGS